MVMKSKVDLFEGNNAEIWQKLALCVGDRDDELKIFEALESDDLNVRLIAYEIVKRFFGGMSYETQEKLIIFFENEFV